MKDDALTIGVLGLAAVAGYAIVRSMQDRKGPADTPAATSAVVPAQAPTAQPVQPVVIQVPTPAPAPAPTPQVDEDYILRLIERVFPKPTPVESPQPVVIQVPTPAPQLDEDYIANLIQRIFPKPTPVEAPVMVQPFQPKAEAQNPQTPLERIFPTPTPVEMPANRVTRVMAYCARIGGDVIWVSQGLNAMGGVVDQARENVPYRECIMENVRRRAEDYLKILLMRGQAVQTNDWQPVPITFCPGDVCYAIGHGGK